MSRLLRTRIVAAVAALSLLPAPCQLQLSFGSGGGDRQPVVNEEGTVVAYGALVGGSRELFVVPVDGGGPVQVTAGAGVLFGFGTFGNWPSLSISSDGTRITYWSSSGVHLVDTVAGTDQILALASLNAYPRIDPSGTLVVYQKVVAGSFEVFLVPASGGAPQQLTSGSGGGLRLPEVRGNLVLFQDVVGNQELFVVGTAGGTRVQVTSGSGGGNRYGHFSSGGQLVVYEAVVSSSKEVWTVQPGLGIPSQQQVTFLGAGGDRLPVMNQDAQIVFQSVAGFGQEVFLVDTAGGTGPTQLTTSGSGGDRHPTTDAHGHVVVYQAVAGASLEVFRLRLCGTASFTPYGSHGTPSAGTLASVQSWYRCELTLGLATSLAPGTPGVLAVSPAAVSPGAPIPGAPGNLLYVQVPFLLLLPVTVDALGLAALTFPIPPGTSGTLFYQWGLADTAANPLGVVTSEGTQVVF